MFYGKLESKNYKVVEAIVEKKNPSEMHENADDVYFVLEGSAKLKMGGSLTEPQQNSPGEWTGEDIENGKIIDLKPGIVVSIPRKTPHMVDASGSRVRYAVVKIY
ncbi:MAG TPA: hypothetical protein VJI75_03440 [Candidatus Nanoarchaeia archaeon]|nr:hypothetical protein [Candidatus Nanoarchaeia archaeon]